MSNDGSFDRTFGTDGFAQFVDLNGFNDVPRTLVIDGAGRIVLAGSATNQASHEDFALVRIAKGVHDVDAGVAGVELVVGRRVVARVRVDPMIAVVSEHVMISSPLLRPGDEACCSSGANTTSRTEDQHPKDQVEQEFGKANPKGEFMVVEVYRSRE